MTVISAPLEKEGAGNAGCALHPRSRVQKSGETHTSIQGSGEHPTFPAQWFDGLCRALPGDEFVFVTVASRIKASRTRLGRFASAKLGTSNGCRDHTVLPYAATRLRQRPRRTLVRQSFSEDRWRRSSCAPVIAHGFETALPPHLRDDTAASTASRPAFVTTRDPPLLPERDGAN